MRRYSKEEVRAIIKETKFGGPSYEPTSIELSAFTFAINNLEAEGFKGERLFKNIEKVHALFLLGGEKLMDYYSSKIPSMKEFLDLRREILEGQGEYCVEMEEGKSLEYNYEIVISDLSVEVGEFSFHYSISEDGSFVNGGTLKGTHEELDLQALYDLLVEGEAARKVLGL